MRAIAEANSLCWDFAYLLQNKIAKEHYLAFLAVTQRLGPVLRKGLLPQGAEFEFLGREWPKERGPNGWFQQYRTLCLRLKAAAQKSKWKSQGWWRISLVTIQPVYGCGRLVVSLPDTCGHRPCSWLPWWFPFPPARDISQARRACVLFLIREYLGEAGVSAASPFQVAPSSLVVVGAGGWAGKRRSDQMRQAQQFRG